MWVESPDLFWSSSSALSGLEHCATAKSWAMQTSLLSCEDGCKGCHTGETPSYLPAGCIEPMSVTSSQAPEASASACVPCRLSSPDQTGVSSPRKVQDPSSEWLDNASMDGQVLPDLLCMPVSGYHAGAPHCLRTSAPHECSPFIPDSGGGGKTCGMALVPNGGPKPTFAADHSNQVAEQSASAVKLLEALLHVAWHCPADSRGRCLACAECRAVRLWLRLMVLTRGHYNVM